MIVKYKSGDTWGYIDNVRQVGNKQIKIDALIDKYKGIYYKNPPIPIWYEKDLRTEEEKIKDIKATLEVIEVTPEYEEEQEQINKAFVDTLYGMAVDCLPDDMCKLNTEYQIDNMLDVGEIIMGNEIVHALLIYTNNEEAVIITNQKVFLLNDKGQTIERLV